MFDNDIFSLLMAAEESMLKADLGVEDSYEAYTMECSLFNSYEDDSYGWDIAMEADNVTTDKKSFKDKLKAAGKWILDGIKSLFRKAAELWHKIIDWIAGFQKNKNVDTPSSNIKSEDRSVNSTSSNQPQKSESPATAKNNSHSNDVNQKQSEVKSTANIIEAKKNKSVSTNTNENAPRYQRPQDSRFEIKTPKDTQDNNSNESSSKTVNNNKTSSAKPLSTIDHHSETHHATNDEMVKYKVCADTIIDAQKLAIKYMRDLKLQLEAIFRAFTNVASNIDPYDIDKDYKYKAFERRLRQTIENENFLDNLKRDVDKIYYESEKIKFAKSRIIDNLPNNSQARLNANFIIDKFVNQAYRNGAGLFGPKCIREIRNQEVFCRKIVAACESNKPEWEIFAKVPNDNKWKKGLYEMSKYYMKGSQIFLSMLSPSQLKNYNNTIPKSTGIFISNAKRDRTIM